ncbi:MAG: ATP-binding protein [Bacillota bacterium]
MFKHMRISRLMKISLAIIFAFVLILGVASYYINSSIWQSTYNLYNHPYIVRDSVDHIYIDVLSMRLELKEMVVDKNKDNLFKRKQAISLFEEDAKLHFNIVREAYLGPINDVDNAYSDFIKWKPIRDDIIQLYSNNNNSEASLATLSNGEGGKQAQKVLASIDIISDFASKKAISFYTKAEESRNINLLTLTMIIGVIMVLMLLIAMYLNRKIIDPLTEHIEIIDDFQQGHLSVRSKYESDNEFGKLSSSFNALAETVEAEIERKERIQNVSEVMFMYDDLKHFSQALLQKLLVHTDSQAGAIYILNTAKTVFEPFESLGFKEKSLKPFLKSTNEGEFAMAISKGEVHLLKDLPSDSKYTYKTVIGDMMFKEILTIPIVENNETVLIISIANIKPFSKSAIQLIENVIKELSARVSSIMASEQIQDYSKKIEGVNIELQQQAKELEMQSLELSEQNAELEIQSKQLAEASQLKSTFLSNMSHELRTPLNSVIALASVLSRRLKGKVPAEEFSYLDVIERNGKQLLSMVNDLLDLSRIEAGKVDLNISHFNIKQLVDEVVEMIMPQANNKGIKVISEMDSDTSIITSDLDKCRHILQNIIGNAVKFTDVGEVVISSKLSNEEISIFVKDTGIGVSAKHIDFIFDEFRQADETNSRKNGGTGLGLAIAKKYALLIGGDIFVESELGKGSTFKLVLPVMSSDMKTTGNPVVGEIVSAKSETVSKSNDNIVKRNILLVEDSEPQIIQIKDILNEEGYFVEIARNGKEALERLSEFKPDGMILDLMMPDVDGFQVLKSIRGLKKFAALPVLILSAKHITKDELSFLKNNHDCQMIQKGAIQKKELLNEIKKLVE